MLRVYRHESDHLVPTDLDLGPDSTPCTGATGAVWLDLVTPTRDESNYVNKLLGISIPTREEALEIEMSARLYHEDGAEFMTMTGVAQLESDEPVTTPITFILSGDTLVTVRYALTRPFMTYGARAQKVRAVPCLGGE
jgi:magnesium transporter